MTCASAAELIEMLFDDRLVWVGLTHGLDWIGLGWVHYSKSTKKFERITLMHLKHG